MTVVEIPFKAEWPEADPRYLADALPQPPALPLRDVFSPKWANWIESAAEAKSAPIDYVVAGVLAACGALSGNARWSFPWNGWAEPPILWAIVIGSPSANKSPGLEAVMTPLKSLEARLRKSSLTEIAAWQEKADLAKLHDSAWKEAAKAAIKVGEDEPKRPTEADPGAAPVVARLAVVDATIEKIADIISKQPRGLLVYRDELSGWLGNMTRYSNGPDKPFWLETYGGRHYTVERMGRDPLYISRLSVGVVGGIQPDVLYEDILKSSVDDGFLARFLPFWPRPVPLKKPSVFWDEIFMENACERLLKLDMVIDGNGNPAPRFIPFSSKTQDYLQAFREQQREREAGLEGKAVSFLGKLPGISVRLSLVLALLDYASGEADEPKEITPEHFARAALMIDEYLFPMALRTYASVDKSEKVNAARKIVSLITDKKWKQFTARDVMRAARIGLATSEQIDPALKELEDADVVRLVTLPAGPRGGRPKRMYAVNPQVLGAKS